MEATTPRRRVLVVGGGTSGNAVTVLLRRAGIDVDLVEARPDWNVRGSGITLQGNALRVLREIGVWDEVREQGFAFDSLGLTAPDGTVLHVGDVLRTGGDDLPATLGMQRPALQRILADAVRASGATVHLGTTAEILTQDDQAVTVRLSDGTQDRYDLVVAADGLHSATRAAIGIDAKPEPTGMSIWRVPAPRPAGCGAQRPLPRRALLHRRLHAHQHRHGLRLSGRAQPRPRHHRARIVRARDAPPRRGVRRSLGRDP